jgi:hypothetical protein
MNYFSLCFDDRNKDGNQFLCLFRELSELDFWRHSSFGK